MLKQKVKKDNVYKYDIAYDSSNYTSVLVKVIKKYDEYVLVQIVGVFKDKPSNYFKWLMLNNYRTRVNYEYLKEYNEEW